MQNPAEAKKRCARAASMLKNLAHPQRLFILCCLAQGETTVGDLQRRSGASQSLISQHLTRMRREGLVQARRSGNYVHYCIADPKLSALIRTMEKMFSE